MHEDGREKKTVSADRNGLSVTCIKENGLTRAGEKERKTFRRVFSHCVVQV